MYDHTLLGEAENGAKKDFFNGKKFEGDVFSFQFSVFSGKEVIFRCSKFQTLRFNFNRFTSGMLISHTKAQSMKESEFRGFF